MPSFSMHRMAPMKGLDERRWLRLALLALVYISIGTTLVICYYVASANGHLNFPGSLGPPAISMLGDLYPEHYIFATGFPVMDFFVAIAVLYRTAQLDRASSGNLFNLILLVLPLIGLPAIVVMAVIPQGSELGYVHLLAAAVGLGLLSLWTLLSSVLSLVFVCMGKEIDPSLPKVLKIVSYLFSTATAALAPVLFLIWMQDVSFTWYEWSGVGMIFVALLPFFILFAGQPKKEIYERLVDPSA